ncbi:hypothetical protein BDR26DRAFT_872519 [Obelidium mucronatum]|nr:hypothetical protein BDR26DRAFT_872519 [Obelidium mucronatum]
MSGVDESEYSQYGINVDNYSTDQANNGAGTVEIPQSSQKASSDSINTSPNLQKGEDVEELDIDWETGQPLPRKPAATDERLLTPFEFPEGAGEFDVNAESGQPEPVSTQHERINPSPPPISRNSSKMSPRRQSLASLSRIPMTDAIEDIVSPCSTSDTRQNQPESSEIVESIITASLPQQHESQSRLSRKNTASRIPRPISRTTSIRQLEPQHHEVNDHSTSNSNIHDQPVLQKNSDFVKQSISCHSLSRVDSVSCVTPSRPALNESKKSMTSGSNKVLQRSDSRTSCKTSSYGRLNNQSDGIQTNAHTVLATISSTGGENSGVLGSFKTLSHRSSMSLSKTKSPENRVLDDGSINRSLFEANHETEAPFEKVVETVDSEPVKLQEADRIENNSSPQIDNRSPQVESEDPTHHKCESIQLLCHQPNPDSVHIGKKEELHLEPQVTELNECEPTAIFPSEIDTCSEISIVTQQLQQASDLFEATREENVSALRKSPPLTRLPIAIRCTMSHKPSLIQNINLENLDLENNPKCANDSPSHTVASEYDISRYALLKHSGNSMGGDEQFESCSSQIGKFDGDERCSKTEPQATKAWDLPLLPSKVKAEAPFEYFYSQKASQIADDMYSAEALSQEFSKSVSDGGTGRTMSYTAIYDHGALRSIANIVAARSISQLEPRDIVEVITTSLMSDIQQFLKDGDTVRQSVSETIAKRLSKELSFLLEVQGTSSSTENSMEDFSKTLLKRNSSFAPKAPHMEGFKQQNGYATTSGESSRRASVEINKTKIERIQPALSAQFGAQKSVKPSSPIQSQSRAQAPLNEKRGRSSSNASSKPPQKQNLNAKNDSRRASAAPSFVEKPKTSPQRSRASSEIPSYMRPTTSSISKTKNNDLMDDDVSTSTSRQSFSHERRVSNKK